MDDTVGLLPETTALERLAACYEAWDRTQGGSLALWEQLMSPRFACLTLCDSVQGRTGPRSCGGREDALAHLRTCTELFELLEHRIESYVEDRSRIVAIGRVRWRHRDSGAMIEMDKLDVWDFEGLHATAFTEFYDTAYMRARMMPAPTAA